MKSSINVLVLDSDESKSKELMKYFSSHDVIKVVAWKKDGEEGLEFIVNHYNDIDVIIMDLLLPKLDGLFILNELRKRGINKSIIITTDYKDSSILDEINNYSIEYYMLKPINLLNLERRIISIDFSKRKEKFNTDALISDTLHTLGVPTSIRGYLFIKEGIKIVYNNGDNISYITKDVYPEVAEKYKTTPSRVERAIRHAIEVSWARGDMKVMEEYFGHSLNINRDKPTNSEYLTTIADRLRINNSMIYN